MNNLISKSRARLDNAYGRKNRGVQNIQVGNNNIPSVLNEYEIAPMPMNQQIGDINTMNNQDLGAMKAMTMKRDGIKYDFSGRYKIVFLIEKKVKTIESGENKNQAPIPETKKSMKRDLTPMPIFDQNGNIAVSRPKKIKQTRKEQKLQKRVRRKMSKSGLGSLRQDSRSSSIGSNSGFWRNDSTSSRDSALSQAFSTMSASQIGDNSEGSSLYSASTAGISVSESMAMSNEDQMQSGGSRMSFGSMRSRTSLRSMNHLHGQRPGSKQAGYLNEKPLHLTTLVPNMHVFSHIDQFWSACELQENLVGELSDPGSPSFSHKNSSQVNMVDNIDATNFTKTKPFNEI